VLKKHQRHSNIFGDDQKQRIGESSSILGHTSSTPAKIPIFQNNINNNIIEGPKEGVIAHKMRLNS
jgi:hypothetical protein